MHSDSESELDEDERGCRAAVVGLAVKGGARDCPYTFMHDQVAGRYTLPWEAQVVHTDGTSCGFAPPEREHAPDNMLPGASLEAAPLKAA